MRSVTAPGEPLKICILHIGHTDPNSISRHPPSPERFRAALTPYLPYVKWTTISAPKDLMLREPDQYDAYLITGGKYSVFDHYPWQDRLFEFVRQVILRKRPLAGICYGHQLIAHVMGAKVVRSPKGYGVGLMPVKVVGDRPWCQSSNKPYWLHAMHQDQLVELPDEAEIFLSSDFCPISGFTIGESVFAIQQHPDFTTGINRDLIARRRDRIGDDVARVAIESLEGRDDTSTSVEWLAEFFKRAVSSATAGSKASN